MRTPVATASKSDLQLDPANTSSDEARTVASFLYEGLLKVDSGNVVGVLAQSWTVSEDGLEYIFNLRRGVTFHDGSALDSDAIVANFRRWFDPNDVNRGAGSFETWAKDFGGFKGEATADGKVKSIFDGIEKVNDLTVLVHLNSPHADFPTQIADPAFVIASPAILAQGFGDGGTGAYQFVSKDNDSVTLGPFAAYWDSASVPAAPLDLPFK